MYRALRLLPLLLPAILVAQDSSSTFTKPYQQQALEIYRSSIAIESSEGKSRVPELARLMASTNGSRSGHSTTAWSSGTPS